MSIQIKSDGTFMVQYEGPYIGLNTQQPATLISDKSSPAFNNFMLRNSEIRSRPALVSFSGGSPGTNVAFTTSFLDANGTYHTVAIDNSGATANLDQLNSTPAWVSVGHAAPTNVTAAPLSYRTFAQILYWSGSGFLNGSGAFTTLPFTAFWDGLASAPVTSQTFSDTSVSNSIAGISLTDSPTVGGSLPGAPTVVGPLAIGGKFIGELNNQLILANVAVRDQGGTPKTLFFPNLVWWSANGLPLQWDPIANTNAGFNAILDVADQITGLATIGIAGYLFRSQGITQFAPINNGLLPFIFDHMWASDRGIGSVLPWSIAQYGPTVCFVASDNIYTLNINGATPIGGVARDSIYTDIANAVSFNPNSTIFQAFASMIPFYAQGFVYNTYNIFLQFPTFIRHYLYSFEEPGWSAWDLAIAGGGNFPALTCSPELV